MPQRPPRAVRFVAAQIERFPPSRLHARVVLRRFSEDLIVGMAERTLASADELACVAEAATAAVRQAAAPGGPPLVTLDRLEHTEMFGRSTVVVTVSATWHDQRRLLTGFCRVNGDPSRAAALAVLNATNRFLGLG